MQMKESRYIDFLLINDYYISSEYEVVNTLFKVMVLNDLWDAQIALRYFEYLNYEGWEYECLIVRGILLENNLSLAGEFCLETKLVQNGLSYFRDNAIWRGKDYDNEDIPVSLVRVGNRIMIMRKKLFMNQIANAI